MWLPASGSRWRAGRQTAVEPSVTASSSSLQPLFLFSYRSNPGTLISLLPRCVRVLACKEEVKLHPRSTSNLLRLGLWSRSVLLACESSVGTVCCTRHLHCTGTSCRWFLAGEAEKEGASRTEDGGKEGTVIRGRRRRSSIRPRALAPTGHRSPTGDVERAVCSVASGRATQMLYRRGADTAADRVAVVHSSDAFLKPPASQLWVIVLKFSKL